MSAVKLIVGLGNPGSQYAETRHNAGFLLLDEIARAWGATFTAEKKFHGETARVTIANRDVRLLKPATFMNLSGESVQPMANFYRIDIEEIVVAHDELDIPPGHVKLKRSGGHGGHNGLRDIIKHCGRDFVRVRLGIGHPGNAKQVSSFVLKRAPSSEQQLLQNSIDDVVRELPSMVAGDLESAMKVLHTKAKPEASVSAKAADNDKK
ncbi:MAG: aminoacyl-tRNA hydrolase [Pseudomonadota bacterium]